jgi:uncharacterized protein
MSHMPILFLGQIFGPTLAAFIMTGVTEGKAGLCRFIGRILEWRIGFQWYLIVWIGIPAIMALGRIVLPGMLTSFKPIDNPAAVLSSYLIFYIYPVLLIGGPLFEEIAWRGFAQPRIQQRFGPVTRSLILGVLWGIWHMPNWVSGQWTVPSCANMAVFVL